MKPKTFAMFAVVICFTFSGVAAAEQNYLWVPLFYLIGGLALEILIFTVCDRKIMLEGPDSAVLLHKQFKFDTNVKLG
jgi:hypothetical protein